MEGEAEGCIGGGRSNLGEQAGRPCAGLSAVAGRWQQIADCAGENGAGAVVQTEEEDLGWAQGGVGGSGNGAGQDKAAVRRVEHGGGEGCGQAGVGGVVLRGAAKAQALIDLVSLRDVEQEAVAGAEGLQRIVEGRGERSGDPGRAVRAGGHGALGAGEEQNGVDQGLPVGGKAQEALVGQLRDRAEGVGDGKARRGEVAGEPKRAVGGADGDAGQAGAGDQGGKEQAVATGAEFGDEAGHGVRGGGLQGVAEGEVGAGGGTGDVGLVSRAGGDGAGCGGPVGGSKDGGIEQAAAVGGEALHKGAALEAGGAARRAGGRAGQCGEVRRVAGAGDEEGVRGGGEATGCGLASAEEGEKAQVEIAVEAGEEAVLRAVGHGRKGGARGAGEAAAPGCAGDVNVAVAIGCERDASVAGGPLLRLGEQGGGAVVGLEQAEAVALVEEQNQALIGEEGGRLEAALVIEGAQAFAADDQGWGPPPLGEADCRQVDQQQAQQGAEAVHGGREGLPYSSGRSLAEGLQSTQRG